MNKIKYFFVSLWIALAWQWYNPRYNNWVRDYFEKRKLEKGMKK